MKRAWALVDQESELWGLFETRDGAEAYRAAFIESDTGAWFKADLPGWLDAFRIVSFALFESTDTVPVNYRLSYEPMDGPMTRPSEGDRPATEAMRREVERRLTAIYAEFPDRPWRRVDGGALIRPLTEAGWGLVDVDLWMCAPHPALGARPVDLIATDRQARLRALIATEAKGVR